MPRMPPHPGRATQAGAVGGSGSGSGRIGSGGSGRIGFGRIGFGGSGEVMARSKHTPAAKGGKWLRSSLRWAIYYRDDFRCLYCAAHGGTLSIDHRVPVRHEGRDNNPANLITACLSCNSRKRAMGMREWYAHLRTCGIEPKTVQQRIRRHTRRRINREVGRFLAWATAPNYNPPED